MAAMETEVVDTDPAATSLENDQTVANQAGNVEEQGQSAEVSNSRAFKLLGHFVLHSLLLILNKRAIH